MSDHKVGCRAIGDSRDCECTPRRYVSCAVAGCLATCDAVILSGSGWVNTDSGWVCRGHASEAGLGE